MSTQKFASLLNQNFQPIDLTGMGAGSNFQLAGKLNPFLDVDVMDKPKKKTKTTDGFTVGGLSVDEFNQLDSSTKAMIIMREQAERADERRREERDPAYMRAMGDEAIRIENERMKNAQEFGKESAMYGYLYKGLPSQITQAAFSKYAFAPEMVKGVQDAYSRLNLAGAIKSPQYMAINA